MNAHDIYPVITVIPFAIVLLALTLLCSFCRGEGEIVLDSAGLWLGVLSLLFCCVQFGVTVAAYSQLSKPLVGSWWIGISCFVSTAMAMMAKGRSFASFASALLLAAFLIGIICTVGDGLYYSHILRGVQSCTNRDGVTWSIETSYETYSAVCHSESPDRDLACIHRNHDTCYYFDGLTNGHSFFHHYTWLFEAGFVFDILLMTVFTLFSLWHLGVLCGLDQHLGTDKYGAVQTSAPASLDQSQSQTKGEVQLQDVSSDQQV